MDPSVQKEIVDILITDVALISNWKKLFDGLKLKAEDFVHLERQWNNCTMKGYELFSTILTQWSSAEGSNASLDELRQVLKDNRFRSIAEKLQNEIRPSKRRKIDPCIWFEVPRATSNFVGRRNELGQLQQLFNDEKFPFVARVTGMGGVGKSELVKNFAKKINENGSADCIWLNGESNQSLKHSIKRLASFVKFLKLDERQQVDDQFFNIISSIQGTTRILVIIDNVDDEDENVQNLIAKILDGRCFFVITSRNVLVLGTAGSQIPLNILPDETAIDLLKQSEINEPDDEIKKLCVLLGNFPLALHQAAAYIKQQKLIAVKGELFKISDYIKIYKTQKRTLLGHKLNKIEHEYRETTLITWNISFDRIKKDQKFGDTAIQLPNAIAYFQPDGIEVKFLKLYQKHLEKAIQLIKTYSLVKIKNGVISIHRLIQQVTRLNLISDKLEIPELTKIITAIQPLLKPAERLVGLNDYLDSDGYKKSLVAEERSLKHMENGMGHIVSVWKYVSKYPQLLIDFKKVLLETVNNLRYFQLFQQVENLCSEILYQLNKRIIYTRSNPELILQIKSELAYAQCRLDEMDEYKLTNLKAVYAKQKILLGEEEKSTLTTAHYVAERQNWGCPIRSNVDEVNIQWCRNIVELKTNVFGPLHKSTFSTKLVLAEHLYCVDEYNQETVKLNEECFQWQMTRLGPEGSGTYKILNSYIKCLLKTDNYEQARVVVEHHLQQALIQSKRMVYDGLSLVLFCLGKTEEAFTALRQSIHDEDISEFDSDLSKYKTANVLLREGNYSEALEIYTNFNVALLGDWWRTDVDYKISQYLVEQGKLEEARDVLQKVLVDLRYFWGNKSQPIIAKRELLDDVKGQQFKALLDFSDSYSWRLISDNSYCSDSDDESE